MVLIVSAEPVLSCRLVLSTYSNLNRPSTPDEHTDVVESPPIELGTRTGTVLANRRHVDSLGFPNVASESWLLEVSNWRIIQNPLQPWKRLVNLGVKEVETQVDHTNCQQHRTIVLHRYFGGNIDQVDCGFHSSRCCFTRVLF